MSAASSLLSEDQFLCSICLDVFTDPVSTPCGHNFCKNCITQHWNHSATFKCPNCNENFSTKPQLRTNTLLSEIVSQFRREAQQAAKPGDVQFEIQQMIQKRRMKIEEIKKSLQMSRDAADREKAEGVQVFTALKECVERGLKQLIKEIEDKHKTTKKQTEDFIKDLEQEISELMERSSEVDQLLKSEDHLHLLQSFSSLKAAPPTKDWIEVRVCPASYEGIVVRALDQLENTMRKQMKEKKKKEEEKVFVSELKRVQQYAVDVTLDPDTASPYLILSDDGKQVKHGHVKKRIRDNPKRFSDDVCVLGKQSFSSGKFYFEVQVKGKTDWALGVARESVNRKGSIIFSPRNGFWTILLKYGNEYRAAADHSVPLQPQSAPKKVGVFVDYEEGLVSFYDVDTAALIYSYPGCCFRQKLYPFFDPCLKKSNKISEPLVITSV
ncbi:E3 ubiquitin-protein ligase TRIM21-like [Pholidichthys leucotaenia]